MMEYITLNNGLKMPLLGLGTYLLVPDDAERSVKFALENGYELIDTANAYLNEKAVGRGILASKVDRQHVFLESKLWPAFYEDDTAIDKTLARLQTSYLDLMILHQAGGNYIAGYHQLEKAYKAGKLKSIGISNFTVEEIKKLLAHCEIVPQLIQVEAHPYFPQRELKKLLKEYHIVLQAWYPVGGRDNHVIMDEPIIKELADKYQKSPVQIILRWHLQMGHVVIPGSKNEAHIKDNLDIFDFALSEEDMSLIKTLEKKTTFYVRTDENLARMSAWIPPVDTQK